MSSRIMEMDACVVLETRSVIDALRSEMQSQILRGSIPAGTALTELSVAQKFDVARPTAKAAIEQLVHIGLLRRLRNKTARVPLLDAADVARSMSPTIPIGLESWYFEKAWDNPPPHRSMRCIANIS